jgi:hypothetical protein
MPFVIFFDDPEHAVERRPGGQDGHGLLLGGSVPGKPGERIDGV